MKSLEQTEFLYGLSLRKIEKMIEQISEGILILDVHSRIIALNKSAALLLDQRKQDVLGQLLKEVFLEDKESDFHINEEEKIVVARGKGKEFSSYFIPINNEGLIYGGFYIFKDISNDFSDVHNQKMVQELAAELNAIFESSYDGIYVTDATGKTLRVNSSYQRITGLSLNQLLGKNIKDIVEEGLISESITFKVLKEKDTVTIKQTISTGKEILVTGSPIFNDAGEIIRVVTNVRDMTDLNMLQKKLDHSLELKAHYEWELSKLRNRYEGNHKIISQSLSMKNIVELAERLAKVDTTVLILGESGVGKELIAQLIHENSSRATEGVFIKINCGAIPSELLESELFGYDEGAFTGAKKGGKVGLFELADKGTLFLDEIGELPLHLQVKLLRVLQEGEFTRVGGTKSINIDVRFISATNKDLYQMVKEKKFREDLYYRLNVVPITIPSLRERKEDILPLTIHYLNSFNKRYQSNKSISSETIDRFMQYSWPGNIRELINTLERMVVTVTEEMIKPGDLPSNILAENLDPVNDTYGVPLKNALRHLEKSMVYKALQEHQSTRKAADALGISQSAIVKKIKKLGIIYDNKWKLEE